MKKFTKLKAGDKVAILSPSFAAPAVFPEVYQLGLKRLRDVFNLLPVEYPSTKKLHATKEERARDLVSAFADQEIKAVIATIGGDNQVTYIKDLPCDVFQNNPKPFLGYSDNTHLANFLWLCGVPSYYGGSVMTQFAMQSQMDDYTVQYIRLALYESGEAELFASEMFNEIGLDWSDASHLTKKREYTENSGWVWHGDRDARGVTWGGCLESIDEMLRHGIAIPTNDEFKNIVLFTETSEEIPSVDYVMRVYRALGERGILGCVRAVLVGRAKAWEFDKQKSLVEREKYREEQYEMIIKTVREYNERIPIILNMDFGHTDPQIPLPYGLPIRIDSEQRKVYLTF